ncbi:hypothetical protein ASPSYDRAFT_59936 [Aspergillus sydowii CBS 593.65]|uniref:F-box domain-containing protein n=1 Tax=Aspergillus sydowii CBS 593.65 TaxID=1036612 RepID=A0A1L9TB72_9EURO|nr:uncharacterized protein ASPSYDRAFT_59936 [Aspergillus sydowii CBS 593.65]OJJ56651.1 hypothetical protein ASPSYDRAFT_59936 [Aspergillus sydowii CBS 593.65]
MTPILSLPTELLLIIFHHLPPTTKHTFSLTCRRLNHIFEPLCPSISIFPETQYALRAALARDGTPFTTYAYCSGCETVHSHRFFTADQMRLSPTTRVCSAAQTNLFIDPATSYSFNHITRLKLKRPYNTKEERARHYSACMMQYAICAAYEVLTLPPGKSASKNQIRSALNGFDIPTCPHVKLGDSVVVDGYRGMQYCVLGSSSASKRIALEEDDEDEWLVRIATDGSDAACRFPGCVTVFKWGCRASLHKGDGWKTLVILVKRYLGPLVTPLDPCWKAQLVTVSDEDRLKRYWEDCFAWRDVNLAIEERRYERELELELQGGTLGEADEVQFDLLRRENDYLRHPHREEMPHIDTGSEESVPAPTKSQGEKTGVTNKSGNIITERNADDLYKPVHTPETMRALIQDYSKFNNHFGDIRALAPYQRSIGEFFWGRGDCLSNPGGVFGLLKALRVPVGFPSRRSD